MSDVRWLDDDEKAAWKHLQLMNLQLAAHLTRELAADGLSYQDYLVLAALSDAPDGRARPGELGVGMGWEKSRLSHHLRRMEQRGLVRRETCPSDQRGSFVAFTDEGRRAMELAAPGHVAVVRRQFVDLLTPEQLATLDDIATTVLAHLPGDDVCTE